MSQSAASKEEHREVVVAELQPDATWKLIQQNTFTRWVNQKLKISDITIQDLGTDFNDGVKLIRLVGVLSGKLLSKYNKKAVFRSQKLENISLALEFLQKEEHIKIINIDSAAIADGNLKLILGLVWTLILHYSISKQVWAVEYATAGAAEPSERTPKQKLMQWVKMRLLPGLPLNNFTSDWNDGVLLGALVDACVPDVGLDWRHWPRSRALESTRTAMQVASLHLEVAPLITAEELTNPAVDEKSVMTYLAQFPQARCTRSSQYVDDGKRASDFVLEGSPPAGYVSSFRVRMGSAVLDPDVTIRNPEGNLVELKLVRLSPTGYCVSYTPTMLGTHEVIVLERDLETQQSRLVFTGKLNVVRGPQLKYAPNVRLGQSSSLKVDGVAGENVEMAIVDPSGRKRVLPVDSAGVAVFVPTLKGVYSLDVFYKKQPVEGSPFPLIVEPPGLTVWGRGILQEGLRVGDEASVNVDADEDLSLSISTRVQTEAGEAVPVEEVKSTAKHRRIFVYRPSVEGKHEVKVTYGDEVISSFTVLVGRSSSCAVRAFGPGLESGVCGQPGVFLVETNGDSDSLGFSIAGPKKAQISCAGNGDGPAVVHYTPEEQGVYQVNVFCQGEHVRGSPFALMVEPAIDWLRPDSVRVLGLDESTQIVQGVETSFCIDTSRMINKLSPEVRVLDREYSMLPVEIVEREPALYDCRFTPELEGRHYISATVGGVAVEGFPFALSVGKGVDPNEVRVFGPGVGNDVHSQQPTHFFINAKGVRPGDVDVAMRDERGSAVHVDVLHNTDGSCTVKYTASLPGIYDLRVSVAGVEVARIEINVKPHVDDVPGISGITIEGLENENVLLGHRKEITVDTNHLTATSRGVQVIAENANGEKFLVELRPDDRGIYTGVWTAQEYGPTKFSVLFDEVLIREATTFVREGQDASKCRASGDGLTRAYVGEPAQFRIDAQGGGDGTVQLFISGPSEPKTSIKDHSNGSCTVEYVPVAAGIYHTNITYGEKKDPIPGSPFVAVVDFPRDPTRILVKECEHDTRIGVPKRLLVDATRTAAAPIDARLPREYEQPLVEEIEPRLYSVTFTPSGRPGDTIHLTLLYDGEPFPESSLEFKVRSEREPDLAEGESRVGGPFAFDAVASSPAKLPVGVTEAGDGEKDEGDGEKEAGEVEKDAGEGEKDAGDGEKLVTEAKVGDASKILVSGPGLANAICHQLNYISVDTRNAGSGGLSVSVEGPSKCEITCKQAKEGLIDIAYRPTEPGIYVLSVKFAGIHVKDSPFTINCTGEGTGTVKEEISKDALQASMVMPGQDATFYLQLSDTNPLDMTAKVVDPTGRSEDAEMRDMGDNFYEIKFKPEMKGLHSVSVFHQDQHVNGSPFEFTVGQFDEGGARKMRACGFGLERVEANAKQSFNLYTREAGKGTLKVSVEGPSKAELHFVDHKDGNCHVDYKVAVPGVYVVSVLFNGEHIPDSPFKVLVGPATGDARRLELASLPDSGLPGEACTLTILTHGAPGHLEGKIQTPSDNIEAVDIFPIDEGQSYALRFIPHEAGNYYLNVTLDGAPMLGSPFRMLIGVDEGNDPTAITATGDGLHSGLTGQKCEFVINTCNAGSGRLEVQIDGPSKVALTAYEVDLGYKVRYVAFAPGEYYAAIRYSGIHILGSPFKIDVSGKTLGESGEPDSSMIQIDALAKTSAGTGTVTQALVYTGVASKVVASGAGLHKFFPGQPAVFNIETGLAGPNILYVGVLTTEGPCEEVCVKHMGSGSYTVKYRIQERAKGFIFIKYGDEPIPGSPFAISF